MKKHLQVTRLGHAAPLCGRQIARPGPGQQVQPQALATAAGAVLCGWCLQKMAERGQELTEAQWSLVAKKSVGRARDGETEADFDDEVEAEAEDE